jgi:hypothetical protein
VLDSYTDGSTAPCENTATHFEPFCAAHWDELTAVRVPELPIEDLLGTCVGYPKEAQVRTP